MVERDCAQFSAAADAIQCLTINHLEAQTKAVGHFHFPLVEQRAGGRNYQDAMGDAAGNEFRKQQAGLNGFAEADAIREQETNPCHANGAKHGYKLVWLNAEATGLHSTDGVHAERRRTGLCPRGEEDDAVRWIAIRHGPDHIHLVAVLARQDQVRPRIVNERYRVRDACLAAEQRYALRSTAPADRTAAASRLAPRPAKPPATGAASRLGPRCAATCPPLPPGWAAGRSSSPGWTRPGCWSGCGTA